VGDRLIRVIRLVVGKIILFCDRFFPAKPRFQRTAEQQNQVDEETKSLALYQFEACPFCVKVRRELKRLGLKVEQKDAKQASFSEELKSGGGELQVPCLRVGDDGKTQWIYESDDIIAYLTQRFHNPSVQP
jgi:glutaredoxin